MKKLFVKDKKLRLNIKTIEKQQFILKFIFKNFNFLKLLRWKAFSKLKKLLRVNSKTSISNRCLSTINRKRLNYWTSFSRHIFLKLIRSGKITGMRKSSW
jgi:ribosomal protein S14